MKKNEINILIFKKKNDLKKKEYNIDYHLLKRNEREKMIIIKKGKIEKWENKKKR